MTDNIQLTPTMSVEGRVTLKALAVVAAIAFISFAQLLAIAGAGILGRPIMTYFGQPQSATWPSEIIVICTVALVPPVSQGADYWGRKWFLVLFSAAGAVGSLIVSRAQASGMVFVGLVIMGSSFASQSLLFAVASEVLPRKHRPAAQAIVNISSGLGALIGVCVGGKLLINDELPNYRIFFYVETGIFAAVTATCAIFYRPPPRKLQVELTFMEKLRRLDWVGYSLFVPGLILFAIALEWSQNPYSWGSAHIVATFTIGIVMLAAFVVYEWRFKKDGMVHHDLFRNRNFPLTLVLIFAEGLSFFTSTNYLSYQVTVFYQDNLLVAGLHFGLIFGATMFFAAPFALWASSTKQVRLPLAFGTLCLLGYSIAMATVKPTTSESSVWGYTILAGAGLGSILPLSMAAVQLSTPPGMISVTSGLVLACRSFGAAVGTPINNAIFTHTLSSQITDKVVPAALQAGLPPTSLEELIGALLANNQKALAQIPGITPEVIGASFQALLDSFSVAFRNIWIVASCFVAVSVLVATAFRDPRDEFNDCIDAPANTPSHASDFEHGERALTDKSLAVNLEHKECL